jgi:mRNA interferase HigB
VIVTGRLIVHSYFRRNVGRKGSAAAKRQFDAWLAEAEQAAWSDPSAIKAQYATASILKGSRVVFNISGNNYRLIVKINYRAGVVDIRFFGTHREYDDIDAEAV